VAFIRNYKQLEKSKLSWLGQTRDDMTSAIVHFLSLPPPLLAAPRPLTLSTHISHSHFPLTSDSHLPLAPPTHISHSRCEWVVGLAEALRAPVRVGLFAGVVVLVSGV
jgi:hypothetical protein